MTEDDVRKLLERKIEIAGGLRAFCAPHDIDPGHASRVMNGAKLSPAILDALGLEVAETVTTYRRKRK